MVAAAGRRVGSLAAAARWDRILAVGKSRDFSMGYQLERGARNEDLMSAPGLFVRVVRGQPMRCKVVGTMCNGVSVEGRNCETARRTQDARSRRSTVHGMQMQGQQRSVSIEEVPGLSGSRRHAKGREPGSQR